jgi:hypothetical protein
LGLPSSCDETFAQVAEALERRGPDKPTELESSLSHSLAAAMGALGGMGRLLHWYKDRYEREVEMHERVGVIGALEATMAHLKGEVICLERAELHAVRKVLDKFESPVEVEKAFKESHLLIKRCEQQQQ